ncbi:MAG: ABC transporter substrate-binding protein [Pseudomonadota bacterium]
MSDLRLAVAGVPEHFNLAWRRIAERRALESLAVDLHWQEVSEGTGRMIDLLEGGDADMALLLTEGAVAGGANGRHIRLLGGWVASPLRWGVHVAAASSAQSAEDLPGQRFAISRFGSGSHLMAGIYAQQNDWPEAPEFVVVDNLAGARRALAAGDAEIFLWERFTTQPVVEAGDFRRVDELPTPWPCFVAAVRDNLAPEMLGAARLALRAALHEAQGLRRADEAARAFAEAYTLDPAQTAEWLAGTRWADATALDPDMLASVASAMRGVDMIEREPTTAELLVAADTGEGE